MTGPQSPRRVVVTGVPRGSRSGTGRTVRQEPYGTGRSGSHEEELRGLVRAQWRTALVAAGGLALTLGGLPLLFALAPPVARARLFGVGIAWIVLGVLAYPLLYGIGRWYVRRAEANEARYGRGSAEPERSDRSGAPR
jgi:hypothetical protein